LVVDCFRRISRLRERDTSDVGTRRHLSRELCWWRPSAVIAHQRTSCWRQY